MTLQYPRQPPTPNCSLSAEYEDDTVCKKFECQSGPYNISLCEIEEAENITCYELNKNLNDDVKCRYHYQKWLPIGNYGLKNKSLIVSWGCTAVFDVCFRPDPTYMISQTEAPHSGSNFNIAKIGVITGGAFLGLVAILVFLFIVCCVYKMKKKNKRQRKRTKSGHSNQEMVLMIHGENTSNQNTLRSTSSTLPPIPSQCPPSPLMEGGDYVYEDIEVKNNETKYNALHETTAKQTDVGNYDNNMDIKYCDDDGSDHENFYNSLEKPKKKPLIIRAQSYDKAQPRVAVYAEVLPKNDKKTPSSVTDAGYDSWSLMQSS